MRCLIGVVLASVIAVVHAHFSVSYPAPRGPFVASNEVNFCGIVSPLSILRIHHFMPFLLDSYTNAVDNRTVYPMSNGVVTLESEHPNWNSQYSILLQYLNIQ